MATYYVRKSGNDSNAGTSAGAAWLTIGKALGASGASSGDTVYVGPGTYREVVTVNATPSSTLSVIGDETGLNTGDTPGEVILSAFTTNDTSIPDQTTPTLALNGKSNLLFQYLTVYGSGYTAGGSVVDSGTSAGTNITFRDCFLMTCRTGVDCVRIKGVASTNHSWTLDRCTLWVPVWTPVYITLPIAASTEYDTNILIQNCILDSNQNGVYVDTSGSGTGYGGGVDVLSSVVSGATCFNAVGSSLSTTYPCTVSGSILRGNVGLSTGRSGQLTSAKNRFMCATNYTNVSAGTGDVTSQGHNFMMNFGRYNRTDLPFTHWWSPIAGSPVLGFAATAGLPTVDLTGRTRPAGGASLTYAAGALELHDTAARETSTVDAGSNAAVITGPGNQHWLVPVTAASTTISCRLRFDTTYGGTGTKPTIRLLANPSIGVTTSSAVCTASANTWQTVSLGAFTPTAAGVVTIRIESTPDAGGGKCFVDTFTIA